MVAPACEKLGRLEQTVWLRQSRWGPLSDCALKLGWPGC